MTKHIKTNLAIAAGSLVLFALLIVCVKAVDVGAIGPLGSQIGLSGINGAMHELLGVNDLWYTVTELFGYLALASAGGFAALGVWQWVTRRSLVRVDRDLWCLAVFYAAVLACYLFFEVVVINRRPILVDGELEASFPSSHTLLVLCFIGAAGRQLRRRLTRPAWRGAATAGCAAVMALTAVGRLLCGVHWFTDILGGLLLSAALLALYACAEAYFAD